MAKVETQPLRLPPPNKTREGVSIEELAMRFETALLMRQVGLPHAEDIAEKAFAYAQAFVNISKGKQ